MFTGGANELYYRHIGQEECEEKASIEGLNSPVPVYLKAKQCPNSSSGRLIIPWDPYKNEFHFSEVNLSPIQGKLELADLKKIDNLLKNSVYYNFNEKDFSFELLIFYLFLALIWITFALLLVFLKLTKKTKIFLLIFFVLFSIFSILIFEYCSRRIEAKNKKNYQKRKNEFEEAIEPINCGEFRTKGVVVSFGDLAAWIEVRMISWIENLKKIEDINKRGGIKFLKKEDRFYPKNVNLITGGFELNEKYNIVRYRPRCEECSD